MGSGANNTGGLHGKKLTLPELENIDSGPSGIINLIEIRLFRISAS